MPGLRAQPLPAGHRAPDRFRLLAGAGAPTRCRLDTPGNAYRLYASAACNRSAVALQPFGIGDGNNVPSGEHPHGVNLDYPANATPEGSDAAPVVPIDGAHDRPQDAPSRCSTAGSAAGLDAAHRQASRSRGLFC